MPYTLNPQVLTELIHVYILSVLSTEEFSFSKLDAGLACYMFKSNSERQIFMWVCRYVKEYHRVRE